jgi:hypothetical protein
MTSTTETIAKMAEEQEDRARLAVERGGLPTEEEGASVFAALQAGRGKLETLAVRVEWLAAVDELPFAVSLEQLGILAVMLSDVDAITDDLRKDAERIRNAISSLAAIRAEQEFQAKQ